MYKNDSNYVKLPWDEDKKKKSYVPSNFGAALNMLNRGVNNLRQHPMHEKFTEVIYK